ncbi:MAG: hypothetical protein KatS3mg034_0521 [Vicingaceae bacterium]|nr:MAG: hypothetical protein KatS3mg034_0521 [Vicingaceae bacterium]
MRNLLFYTFIALIFLLHNFLWAQCSPTYSCACLPTYSTGICSQPNAPNTPGNFINDFINDFYTTGATQNINNLNSGCNAYYTGNNSGNNFTNFCALTPQGNQSFTLVTQPGQNITFYLSSGNTFSQGFCVWIDWNKDCVYSGTEVVAASPNVPPAATLWTSPVYTVPLTVQPGQYKLRARCIYATPGTSFQNSACQNASYGEIEEYTVIVIPPGSPIPVSCSGSANNNPVLAIGGNSQVCANNINQLYYAVANIPANCGATFNWQVNNGATIVSGQGNDSVYINFNNVTAGNVTITVTWSDGCCTSPPNTLQVTVDPKPSTANAGPDQYICGSTAILTANNPTSGTGQWSVIQGGATIVNPNQSTTTVNNLSVGVNKFVWTISSNLGFCTPSRDTVVIVRYPQPIASFNATSVCHGNPTTFTNTSNANGSNIVSYAWDVNADGIIDTNVANFSYTYPQPGIYNVSLIITSSDGCKDTATQQVVVNPKPVADFANSPVCENQVSNFFDLSNILSGQIVAWNWNFGDGNSSNLQNPTHVYSPGTYTVTLTVTSDSGCVSSISKVVQVYANPVANFKFQNQCLYDSVYFYDFSTVNNAVITQWEWTFGDVVNNTSTQQHPVHLYSTNGVFTTQLIVTSSQGCKDTVEKQVYVHPIPNANFNTSGDVCLGNPIQFNDLSNIPQGGISYWKWYFGDGNSSTQQNPQHNYQSPGKFQVTLIVQSDSGCLDTVKKYVNIWPLPKVDFSFDQSCQYDTVFFTNLSTILNGSMNYLWTFGDGSPQSNVTHAEHIYQQYGKFNVTLTATSEKGCQSDITKEVEVYPAPKAEFTYSDLLIGCSPLCVNFYDLSTVPAGSIAKYRWDFGDSLYSSQQNPRHCYVNTNDSAETYRVLLTVVTDMGCVDTFPVYDLVHVYPQPVADFDFTPYSTTIFNADIEFTNYSVNGTKWYWDFGDGHQSYDFSPTHTYADTGKYTVTLTVYNDYECVDSINYTVWIRPEFAFYIPSAFTPNNDGMNDIFKGKGFGIREDQFEMNIYDRWGNLIYSTNDIQRGWDGNVGGQPAPLGVYVYQIKITLPHGEDVKYLGQVNLLR